MNFRFALCALIVWASGLLSAGAQVIPPPMKQAPGGAKTDVAPPTPTKAQDSVRSEGLVTDTKVLRHIDSLRRANTSRLEQIQTELLTLKSGTADKRRERELVTELDALRRIDSLRKYRSRRYIDSLKVNAKGFPVVRHDDTLFYVYTRLGPFSPQERAQLTEEKIKRLEKSAFFSPDSLRIYPSEQSTDLMYGEQVLQSISENDALWHNVSRDSLARLHQARIITAVQKYKQANSLLNMAKEIGLTLLVLIVLYFTVKYIFVLFRWIRLKLAAKEGVWFKGIKFGNYEFFNEQRQLSSVLLLLTILKWVVVLLAIYLVLPIVFSIFPGTQDIADTLLGFIFNPLKKIALAFWNYLPNLFTIIVIVAVFRYVLKAIFSIKEEVRAGNLTIEGFYPDWANPTYQIVRVLVWAFALIVIFPYLPGSDSPVFQGVSVFLGFLFTFGSAGSLSNIVAGLVLTYMRAYKLGDRVRIGDVTGDIVEKTLLVTRIRTIKNEEITIPNSSVMSSYTTNYSTVAPTLGLIMHTGVTIGYDVPWPQVHQLLLAAAVDAEVLTDPAPFVLQTSLDDWYVAYELNFSTHAANKQAGIYSRIHQNIQDRFNEAGVEIMSPHYRALRDGNQTTIPADYLSKDYDTPKFRVDNSGDSKPAGQ